MKIYILKEGEEFLVLIPSGRKCARARASPHTHLPLFLCLKFGFETAILGKKMDKNRGKFREKLGFFCVFLRVFVGF